MLYVLSKHFTTACATAKKFRYNFTVVVMKVRDVGTSTRYKWIYKCPTDFLHQQLIGKLFYF